MRDPLTTYSAMITRIESGDRMIDGTLLKAIYMQLEQPRMAASVEPGYRLVDETLLRDLAKQLTSQQLQRAFQQNGKRLIKGGPWKQLAQLAGRPFNRDVPAITGLTAVGSTLTCTMGNWNGAPTSYAYQWKRGSTNVGSNQNTYVTVAGDSGQGITCVVTATNQYGSTVAPPSNVITVAVALLAPVNTVAPAVAGGNMVGDTVSVNNGTWDNLPTSFTYQWRRGLPGANIVGATSDTYLLDAADVGQTVYCRVTATNATGSASISSTTIDVIAAAVPTNTTAPVVAGNTGVGDTLICGTGVWTGSPTSYTYDWQAEGISTGTTTSNFVIQASDAGSAIRCVVTAHNATGASIPQESNTVVLP